MIPVDWMDHYAPGLRNLSAEERHVITDFLFLWTILEARALQSRTNPRRRSIADRIIDASEQWAESGLLATNPFRRELAYFRGRYVDMGGKFTPHFRGLRLRGNDRRNLVMEVLTGNHAEPHDVAAVALIIAYRLRSNLFKVRGLIPKREPYLRRPDGAPDDRQGKPGLPST